MERNKDQMPAGGCNQCGAYAGETQSYKRKRLVWDGSDWVCNECNRESPE